MKENAEPLKNLVWYEFLRSNSRSLVLVGDRASEALDLAKQLHSDVTLIQKIVNLLEEDIPIAKRYFSQIEKETYPGQRLKPKLHRYYADKLDQLESTHSDIMTLLLQPFLKIASKTTGAEYSSRDIEKFARFFKVPPTASLACNKILDHCMFALYNEINPIVSPLEPLIVHWVHYYYKFRPPSAICMPWIDMAKLCHWPHLSHESFHSKIFNIFDNILEKRKDANSGQVHKYDKMLCHLLSDSWPSIVEKWDSLEERFIETIGNGLRRTYKKLYHDLMDDNFLIADRFLQYQFQEFVCDAGATKIAGPSSVLHYACICADNLRNPVLDVVRHLTDMLHPPDIVRTRSQLFYMSNQDLWGKEMNQIRNLIEDLVMVDLSNGFRNEREELCSGFVQEYFSLLNSKANGNLSLLDEIRDLTNSMLNQKYCYGSDRWQNLVSNYGNHLDPDDQSYRQLYPYDFVNIVWLKLMKISTTISSYEEYLQEYTKAESDLKTVWRKLTSCNFSTRTTVEDSRMRQRSRFCSCL